MLWSREDNKQFCQASLHAKAIFLTSQWMYKHFLDLGFIQIKFAKNFRSIRHS
jgi:hypothetical protein